MNDKILAAQQEVLKDYFGNIQRMVEEGRNFTITLAGYDGTVSYTLEGEAGTYLMGGEEDFDNISAAVLAVNSSIEEALDNEKNGEGGGQQ